MLQQAAERGRLFIDVVTYPTGRDLAATQLDRLTFGEYQKLFRVSKSTTARDLEGLLAMELLEKRGKTRAVVYLPGPKLREIAKKFGRG